jgi:threonine/homoserine/homoserine lactone efflux protein
VEGLWGFALLAALLSLSPGPDDVLVIGSTVRGGPRCGLATAAGVAAGSLVWGLATGIGLAGALSSAPVFYDGVRYAGAAYLVALGAGPLLAPLVHRVRATVPAAAGTTTAGTSTAGTTAAGTTTAGTTTAGRSTLRGSFAAGLLSDVLNPKIGLFYLALVPQFVPVGAPVFWYCLLLSAIDIAVALAWFAVLTGVAALTLRGPRRPRVALWSERVLGAFLVGVGVAAALGG